MASVRRQRTSYRQGQWAKRFREIQNGIQQLFVRGDISVFVITLGILLMPALSLWRAEWPLDMGIVLPMLSLSLLIGFMLARSQYNELLALLMSGVYGMTLALLIAALNQPGGLRTGVYDVFNRLVLWVYAALNEGVNPDDLVFTIMVASLFWFLGYNIAWHTFRIDRMFRVVMPPGLILITNTVYYNGTNELRPFVVIFLFLALLLAVRSYLDAQEWEWYMSGLRVPSRVRRQFNRVGLILALLVVAGSWAVPADDLQKRLDAFQEFMQADPFRQMSEVWNRLFSTIDAYGPVTADYYGGDSLELGGAIQLGDQVVIQVAAPPGRRYYWRSRIYDAYQDGNWTSQALKRVPYLEIPVSILSSATNDLSRQAVQQEYTIGLNASRLVYAASQPVSVSLPVRVDLRFLDPNETIFQDYVIRPFQILERGDTYTVTSLMTNATASELRSAGEDYPAWIRETQLYVPPSVTGRTLALAQEIVNSAGAVTPYDKAKAIERWLRTNIIYNETIPTPPSNQDPIDWVLFDYREGYCNYYASAMVVMLRSQGVPARMAAGFAEGEWNGSSYVVRERDAHTWVEVYFPGYGWIEFEPTAAQAPLNRGDEDAPSLPTATPRATNTPTVSPTPPPTATPTMTPTLSGSVTPPENEQLSLPTSTPTLTPTPTATPVILPTAEPPLPNDVSSGFNPFLTVFLALLVVLAVLLVLASIGLFVWWWFEWRGVRELSPVVRAYVRLERYVSDLLGIRLDERDTPFERQGRILRELPRNAERPVSSITEMYVRERYGNVPQSPDEVARHVNRVDNAWRRTRESVLSRWVRRVIPFSRWLLPRE